MKNDERVKLSGKQNFIQFLKFTLFSASAGIIQVITFTLLYEVAHVIYWPSYLIGLIFSVLYNFTINRRFTFKSAANIPKAMIQIFIYYLIFTPLSTWWGDALEGIGWNGFIVLAGTMIINFVTEFSVYRFIIYGDSINTSKHALN
ncbi:MAG: GtrA family protein [Saccharofermentanales bacterium]